MPTNMPTKPTKPKLIERIRPGRLAATALGVAAIAGGTATALAADEGDALGATRIDPIHEIFSQKDRVEYRRVYERAKRLGIKPKRNLAAQFPTPVDLEERTALLRLRVVGERGRQKLAKATKPKFGTPESVGVDSGTLESIAACESGGDPTVIDASGTYHGKYQFDLGTWASVGGSGNPAAAPEAEQDYRAALLYSRAGAGPWPVCGS